MQICGLAWDGFRGLLFLSFTCVPCIMAKQFHVLSLLRQVSVSEVVQTHIHRYFLQRIPKRSLTTLYKLSLLYPRCSLLCIPVSRPSHTHQPLKPSAELPARPGASRCYHCLVPISHQGKWRGRRGSHRAFDFCSRSKPCHGRPPQWPVSRLSQPPMPMST